MGAKVDHLQRHPRTGVLRFRRMFPPALRRFIEGPAEFKRSLFAKTITAHGAMDRFTAASAEFDAMVARARKLASGTFDSLDDPTIAYLAAVFRKEDAEYIEKRLRDPDSDTFAEQALVGIFVMEDEYLQWRLENDVDAMIDRWGSTADALLNVQGIILDPQEEDALGRLCRALNDVAISTRAEQRLRLKGEVIPIPAQPEPPIPMCRETAATAGPMLSFDAIAEDILTNAVPPIGPSTREGARTALRFLREAHGLLPPAKIDKGLVTAWIRLMAQRPAKVPAGERSFSLPEIVARYADRPDVPRLTQKTLSQHVGHLAALWTKAQAEGTHIPDALPNPFAKRKFEVAAPPEVPQELSPEELRAIFALPIFTRGERPLGGKGEASYWLPLLLLWTGARPEEVAQLTTSDIFKSPDGRWMLRITDEGTHPAKGKRTLKTGKKGTGRRTFPIPQALLDLDLIGYVDSLRAAGEVAMFPLLRVKGQRGTIFDGWGIWWSLYLRQKAVLPADKSRRASREFRHNWATAARASLIPQDVREYIMGHGSATTSRRYGSEEAHGEWIDKLAFTGLDLSAVKPWAPLAAS